MQIADPIRPYLAVIRVAAWAVLLGSLFVAGCRHGEKTATADAAKQVSGAQQDARDALGAANACGQALADVSTETDKAKAAAAARQALAERQAAQAVQASAAAQARADAAAKALQIAKATPTCAAQLAIELCPSIPIL